MNKWMKRTGLLALLMIVGLLSHPLYRARAAAAWEVLFNGTPSSAEVMETESGLVVPVYFEVPADGEPASYGVLLEADSGTKQVKVTRVKKKGPLTPRGGDCPKCMGTKKCQDCYPAGSGVNTSGYECYSCNGTGDCPYCNGSGKCYQCGGAGYPGGCWTCGEDSN